jgi:hypothetical protein
MNMPVDETITTLGADSGSTYRYDGGRYIYNWKTLRATTTGASACDSTTARRTTSTSVCASRHGREREDPGL